jgi:hypothetical protein
MQKRLNLSELLPKARFHRDQKGGLGFGCIQQVSTCYHPARCQDGPFDEFTAFHGLGEETMKTA